MSRSYQCKNNRVLIITLLLTDQKVLHLQQTIYAQQMTQVVLPGMVRRKRGLILNVASMAAVRPIQIMTMYSATKTFINFFSQGLSYEYESKGITIQASISVLIQYCIFKTNYIV